MTFASNILGSGGISPPLCLYRLKDAIKLEKLLTTHLGDEYMLLEWKNALFEANEGLPLTSLECQRWQTLGSA